MEFNRWEIDDVRNFKNVIENETSAVTSYKVGNRLDRVETYNGLSKSLVDAISKMPHDITMTHYIITPHIMGVS